MQEFEAQKLVASIRALLANAHLLVDMRSAGSISPPLVAASVGEVRKRVDELLECCKAARLPMSVLAVQRLLVLFNKHMPTDAVIDSVADAALRTVIVVEDELSLRLYFSLEPDEANRFRQPWDGWEKIIKRFGDITRDVEEINKCFAFGRYPGSMFHALHVAEWGAIELGQYIGVTDPKRGWGPTERKLAEIVKGGHSALPSALIEKFEFLEQMNREVDSMVLAWRHKVDHAANHLAIVPNVEFTPDIAEHIIGSVRVFMTRLVDGIPE